MNREFRPTAVMADVRVRPLWAAVLLAATSGPIMDAGFPDVSWWPLTFVGIGIFLVSLRGRRPGGAFLVGFVGGLTFYLVQIGWAALFLGPVPLAALSTLESIFVGGGAVLISIAYRVVPLVWISPLGRLGWRPAVVAGLWTLREGIASVWPYGGFSWARVAESQSQSPFSSLFSWIGISGVSFVMVFLVALALEAVLVIAVPELVRGILVVGAIALIVLVPAYPIALKGTTTVAAVQGAGPAGYFDPHDYGDLLAAQYKATVPLFGRKGVDMVIWPEGASDIDPVAADHAPDEDIAATEFDDISTRMHAPLLAGTIQHRGSKYFNTSLLWEAGKGAVDHYDKKHPVPFGEYVPDRAVWRAFAPGLIDLVGRDYTPGTTDTVFNVNGVIAGIDICFDITDDTVMRDSIKSGAQILIAQTNNGDFGHTDESIQQLEIARIRAMELGRSLVNDSTVGTTAIVLPNGKTVSQLPTYKAGALVATVPLSTTITPATWLGEPIEQLVSVLGLGGLIVASISTRKRKERQR
ncbi:MAG: apolipoprotein N-acyltransferase [Actinomycetota bacterium]|jgi:apolipoprotein N-acyltransferase|nr:apolipoprotein N-acyltransferase [Actinomycetota bacterium]